MRLFNRSHLVLGIVCISALVGGCDEGQGQELERRGPPNTSGEPGPTNNGPGAPPGTGGDDQLVGASAEGKTNIVSQGWAAADIRFGNNVKMLNFEQMKSEVARATGVTSIDWDSQREVFGGADYKTTFAEDRTTSATKLIAFRKLVAEACEKMVVSESTKQVLFTSTTPKAAIKTDDPKVDAQVKLMFARAFMREATAPEFDVSKKALGDLVARGAPPEEAWTGLCVGYLSSLRFLSY